MAIPSDMDRRVLKEIFKEYSELSEKKIGSCSWKKNRLMFVDYRRKIKRDFSFSSNLNSPANTPPHYLNPQAFIFPKFIAFLDLLHLLYSTDRWFICVDYHFPADQLHLHLNHHF